MKKLFTIIGLSGSIIYFTSCHKTNVGFLVTDYASYQVDSMVVKTVASLDTTAPVSIPNPVYGELLGFGLTPDYLLSIGVYPTVEMYAGVDYTRNKLAMPWTSTALEGVEGTAPMLISIRKVTTDSGDIAAMLKQLTVRGNGIFTLPVKHSVPGGHYKISLSIKNEGYSRNLDNIYTIIIN